MNVKKIDLRSISPPPPSFNMQVIQQELRRLAQDHTEVQEKLREHKAKADAVDELFAYAEHSVQKHEVDPSAIFNDSPTLSERLAALEDIAKRLEQDELTSRPLLQKVSQLETSVFLQDHESTIISARMARLEQIHQALWKGAESRLDQHTIELGSIREEHQRFEAEMKETTRALENKWEVTPGALEERLTKAIGTLTARVDDVEKSLMTMVSTVTAVSEQHLKLSSRQSTLEQLIIQYLGNKVKKEVEVDATRDISAKATLDIGINTDSHVSFDRVQNTRQVQGSKSPGLILLAPNPVLATGSRSASPFPIGNRKSPRLQEKDLPVPSSGKCFVTDFGNLLHLTPVDSTTDTA
jgi:chromosome segregation ATPase